MTPGHLLVVYHGCDATTRDDLVSGRLKHLSHSENKYDWLGRGSYFFEDDLERALMFARASCANPGKMYTHRAIATPAAVGAILCIARCLDMTKQTGIVTFKRAYGDMIDGIRTAGVSPPVNKHI
jgi:hypothetical protein